MWALVIIIANPFADHISGVIQIAEQVLVQTFVAEASIERLAKRIV